MLSYTRILYSDDIDESIRFYKCIGFRKLRDDRSKGGDSASVIYSGSPSFILNFYTNKGSSRLDNGYDKYLTFTVENIEQILKVFEVNGFKANDVQDIPIGMFAYFTDPFGYHVIISKLYIASEI